MPIQKAHNELLFGCSTTAVSMNHPWGLELKRELYSLPLLVTISEFPDLVQIYHCMKLQTEKSDIDTCGLEWKKRMLHATKSKVSAFSPDWLMRSTSGPYSWLQLLLNSPRMLPELFRNRFCHSVFINVFMFLTKWKQNRPEISQNLCECVSLSVCFWQLFTFIFKCKLYGTAPFYVH